MYICMYVCMYVCMYEYSGCLLMHNHDEWLYNFTLSHYPPYSPDLEPSDFHLFGAMKGFFDKA